MALCARFCRCTERILRIAATGTLAVSMAMSAPMTEVFAVIPSVVTSAGRSERRERSARP
jgi:hypothetical protein